MKYFIDTEFIEGFHGHRKRNFLSSWFRDKPLHTIQLVSIGIVDENGRSYSAISNEYRYKDASDWVKENVIVPLYMKTVSGDARNCMDADNFHKVYGEPLLKIMKGVLAFTGCVVDANGGYGISKHVAEPQFYGYYADYDWVLFCSLFGTMMDLPKGFPMYCNDLKQELDRKVGNFNNSDFLTHFHVKMPMTLDEKLTIVKKRHDYPVCQSEHDSLNDANWNRQLYKFLVDL